MLTIDQIADILNSNFKIHALLENANALQIDPNTINKLNQDKKDLEEFFNKNKNSNIEKLPDNIQNIVKDIKQLTESLPKESTEIISGLNIEDRSLKCLIEIYTSEESFLNFMKNINLEKFISELKNEIPEEFQKHQNLESMLNKSFSNYHSVLNISLYNSIDIFIQDTHNQFKSDKFLSQLEKMFLGSFNYEIMKNLDKKLSQKNKEKYDSNSFLVNKGNLNFEQHTMNVLQRPIKYKSLLEQAIRKNESKINKNNKLLEENLIKINETISELNELKKVNDYYSIKNIPIDNYEDIKKLQEIVEKKQSVIKNSIVGTISIIISIIDKEKENLSKKNNPIYITQISGYEKITRELNNLKNTYKNLEYITDSEIKIFSQLNEIIKKTENNTKGFKANKNIDTKSILKKINGLEKDIKNEFYIDEKLQNETVKKMQLNLINEIIEQLDKAQKEAEKKCDLDPKNHKLKEKKAGLNELYKSYQDLKHTVENSDSIIYKKQNNLGKMMTRDIYKQKQQHPLMTAGIFSKNKQILKQIETRINQHQASIDHAIKDQAYAERISKSVDDKFDKFNNPKPR